MDRLRRGVNCYAIFPCDMNCNLKLMLTHCRLMERWILQSTFSTPWILSMLLCVIIKFLTRRHINFMLSVRNSLSSKFYSMSQVGCIMLRDLITNFYLNKYSTNSLTTFTIGYFVRFNIIYLQFMHKFDIYIEWFWLFARYDSNGDPHFIELAGPNAFIAREYNCGHWWCGKQG